jgi:fermentation-respiration switch protein FrsA (DUF1100 family)
MIDAGTPAAKQRAGTSLVTTAPAARHYWFLPVRLFLKDKFSSDLWVGKVRPPVLVHGEEDTVVPITLGERLYAMIQAPKHFVRVAGGEHSDLGARAVAAAKRFVAESRGRVSSGSAP